MAGSRYIPERTVDSLLAAEIMRYDPYATIWSPSQRDPNPIDHEVFSGSGKVLVFECKAVDLSTDGNDQWQAPVDRRQLERYLKSGAPVLYLLLSRPTSLEMPWAGRYTISGNRQWCRCCARDERAWSALSDAITTAPVRRRLQPWFAHWAWVISADMVKALLDVSKSKNNLVMDSGVLECLAGMDCGVTRLCHVLAAIASGEPPEWITENIQEERRLESLNQLINSNDGEGEATPPVIYGVSHNLA